MNASFGRIEPTINAPLELLLLLSDPFAQYRDGTTTRVYRHKDDRVIVVTGCAVKTAFLKALSLVPGGVPGLPVVHRDIGAYAKDADDRSLFGHCFEVEELDDPVAEDAMHQQSLFVDGARALVGCDYGIDPKQDAALADLLAAADIEGTGQAFHFIAGFLRSHDAVLDALAPRHIMFTKAGRLCLADAVSFVPPPLEEVVTVFPGTVIRVNTQQRSGVLTGVGIENALYGDDDEDGRGEAAADAIESLLLAMAVEGIDVGSPAMRRAIDTALEAIGQNL